MAKTFLIFETKLIDKRQFISLKWVEEINPNEYSYSGFSEFVDSLTAEQSNVYDEFISQRATIHEKPIIPDNTDPTYIGPEG